jgi:hypothetical protein
VVTPARYTRRTFRAVVGLLAAGLASCLLPGEPSTANRLVFQMPFETPFRVPLRGTIQPDVHVAGDGKRLDPSFHLESLSPELVQVDSTGKLLIGVSRGTGSVRVVFPDPLGTQDTMFSVQVVVSEVKVLPAQQTITRLNEPTELTVQAYAADRDVVPNLAFTWASSDSTIVRLASPGTVTAVEEGAATITAQVDGVVGLLGSP